VFVRSLAVTAVVLVAAAAAVACGTGEYSNVNDNYYCYNSIAWQTDEFVDLFYPFAENILTNTLHYDEEIENGTIDECYTLDNNPVRTTNIYYNMASSTATCIVGHANSNALAVEYYTPTIAGAAAALVSVLEQTAITEFALITDVENTQGEIIALMVAVAGEYFIEGYSATNTYQCMAIGGCNSAGLYPKFEGSATRFAYAGVTPSTITDEDLANALEEFWLYVGCMSGGDNRLYENFVEAAEEVDLLSGFGDEALSPNPCVECTNDGPVISRYGKFGNTVYGAVRSRMVLEKMEVVGYGDDGKVLFRREQRLEPLPTASWGGAYIIEIVNDAMEFEIVFSRGDYSEHSHRFRDGEKPQDWEKLMSKEYWDTQPILTNSNSGVRKSEKMLLGKEYSPADIIIVANQDPNFYPQVLMADLNSRGKDVWLEPALQWPGQITALYEQITNENIVANNDLQDDRYPVFPGPELIIYAGVGECDECIGSAVIEDYYESCLAPYGQCRSDLLITDYDDDERPNGPVTRIPAGGALDGDAFERNADEFNDMLNLAPYRQVMMLCDDDYAAHYMDVIYDAMNMYSRIGYIPLTPIRTSQLHGVDYPERFEHVAGIMNAGVVEVFGRGEESGPSNWFNIIDVNGYAEQDFDLLVREQTFISWLPSCGTTINYNWDETSQLAVWLRFMQTSNPAELPTRMAAIVGHLNAGWRQMHDRFARSLLEARENATPGETSVARITWDAVMDYMDTYPEFHAHALGVGVLGSYVVVPDYGPAGVDESEELSATAGIRVFPCMGQRPQIKLLVPWSGRVRVDIYDIRGRKIVNLIDAQCEAGEHSTIWDGRNASGASVASGMYVARAELGGIAVSSAEAKIMIVR